MTKVTQWVVTYRIWQSHSWLSYYLIWDAVTAALELQWIFLETPYLHWLVPSIFDNKSILKIKIRRNSQGYSKMILGFPLLWLSSWEQANGSEKRRVVPETQTVRLMIISMKNNLITWLKWRSDTKVLMQIENSKIASLQRNWFLWQTRLVSAKVPE